MASEITPEDQAVLDAAEAYRDFHRGIEYGTSVHGQRVMEAVNARRKAREPKQCKHRCGLDVVPGRNPPGEPRFWVHVNGTYVCGTHAEPDDSPAMEAR